MKKLTALALSCILLVGVFFGTAIFASADVEPVLYNVNEDLPVGELNDQNFNVEYQSFMHLAVEITNTDNGLTNGIFVYPEGTTEDRFAYTEPIYSTYTIKSSTNGQGHTVYYCATQGIAAKDIDVKFRIVAVSYDESTGEYNFGNYVDYSIADYCDTQIDRHDNHDPETGVNPITEAQYTLYNAIINYGKAAQAVLKP